MSFNPSAWQLTMPTAAGDQQAWSGLFGAAEALAIAHAAEQHPHLSVVITADTPTALRLESELLSVCRGKGIDLLLFPDWETLPYDQFSPHQDIISQRLRTLHRLRSGHRGIVLVPVNTLMQRIAPTAYLEQFSLLLSQGQAMDLEQMRERLAQSGYQAVQQVLEHGEFSVRGSLLDLYPMGSKQPYRIDFFDDEIDSIRAFDPESQRSSDPVANIELLPAKEFPTDDAGIEGFRQRYRQRFEISRAKESLYQQVSKGLMPPGIEYYLPLFFDQCATLFDYLPTQALLLLNGDLVGAAERYWQDCERRYQDRRYDNQRPLLPPAELFIRHDELFGQLKPFARISLTAEPLPRRKGISNAATEALPEIAANHQLNEPFRAFSQWQRDFAGQLVLATETAGRRESLQNLLSKASIKTSAVASLSQAFEQASDQLSIVVAPFERGFVDPQQHFALVTENEMLGQKVRQKRRSRESRNLSPDTLIRNLAELQIGQPVVHIQHGVGRYRGLQLINAGGMDTEFVTLEFANGDKLYVPVASLHLIGRYSGDAEHAPLHKLGSESWSKARRKAAEKARDVAAELLDIYARREAKPGHAFRIDEQDYARFCASFPFEETPDQQQAIAAVSADMHRANAMDRLVCGDVGFGKTEVAMRAAFIAVQAGKQVAVLVPTTLLAQQHFENFRDRFADWPVQVEVLSRFRTAKEQKEVLQRLAEGKVDILIGTHKVLQKEVQFDDLGLLIVDEEHRFGVRQKEAIKSLRADVDILTLTATPIPRTLNMALGGMRDLSIIATPPARRLAVRTFVRQRENALIREAVLRELLRGGQVYFLHNSVETIDKTAEELAELLPEARIAVAHGQMRERELEQVMSDFYHHKFNLLLCTTIIETGIDVPNANTIIMDRADALGLAQLHQLRGRVGRSHHQAYAYLLTPPPKRITKDAQKRLEAIEQLEDLGAGFALATHDLEIRGAGELLGEEQSGQINAVGFSLYMEMLEKAVQALKQGKEPSLEESLMEQTEVELRVPALLPDDYIHEVNLRLSFYKRIASAADAQELDDIQVELIDRFGLLPPAARNLFAQAQIRQRADKLGLKRVDLGPQGGTLEFSPSTRVNPAYLIQLLQQQPNCFKMDGPDRLRFNFPSETSEQRLQLCEDMLSQLEANVN